MRQVPCSNFGCLPLGHMRLKLVAGIVEMFCDESVLLNNLAHAHTRDIFLPG